MEPHLRCITSTVHLQTSQQISVEGDVFLKKCITKTDTGYCAHGRHLKQLFGMNYTSLTKCITELYNCLPLIIFPSSPEDITS